MRGGLTFGVTGGNGSTRDRDAGADRRLAGLLFFTNEIGTFKISGIPAGTYNVTLALGDAAYPQRAAIEVLDNTASRFSIADTLVDASHFLDAAGVDRTKALWPSTNVVRTGVVINSGDLVLKIGATGTGANYVISHISIVKTD